MTPTPDPMQAPWSGSDLAFLSLARAATEVKPQETVGAARVAQDLSLSYDEALQIVTRLSRGGLVSVVGSGRILSLLRVRLTGAGRALAATDGAITPSGGC